MKMCFETSDVEHRMSLWQGAGCIVSTPLFSQVRTKVSYQFPSNHIDVHKLASCYSDWRELWAHPYNVA